MPHTLYVVCMRLKKSSMQSKTIEVVLSNFGKNARFIYIPVGKRVFVRQPPSTCQSNGLPTCFTRRYEGAYTVVKHVHGRSDLLKLRHELIGKELPAVNIKRLFAVLEPDPNLQHSQRQTNQIFQFALPRVIKIWLLWHICSQNICKLEKDIKQLFLFVNMFTQSLKL